MSGHHHFQLRELARLSTRLDELLSVCGAGELSYEAADEVTATAGEVMLLLADHGDEMVCGALDDARRSPRGCVANIALRRTRAW